MYLIDLMDIHNSITLQRQIVDLKNNLLYGPVIDLLVNPRVSFPHAIVTYLSTTIRTIPPLQWVAINT